jgi:hypothetical protein
VHKPVFDVHGVCKVSKHRGMTPHEVRPLVSRHLRHLHLRLVLRLRLLLLHLLHGCQGLTNRLDYLSLHQKHLLDCHWGWWWQLLLGCFILWCLLLLLARLPPWCLLSNICRKHTHSRSDLAVFQHKKRYIEVFTTLNKMSIFTDPQHSQTRLLR